jgi:hypothetical protein
MENEKRQKGGDDKGHNNHKLSEGEDEDEEGGSSKISYGYL